MIPKFAIIILLMAFTLCAACSHTPGDAALRGGHPDAAADLYKKGAELGDPDAALKLGLLISDGSAPESKYGEASIWYQKACDLGSLPACHNMGVAYEYGQNGVSKDLGKAYDYYLKAADRGFMQSQYNLASLYSNGYVEPPNDVEGYKWMILSQDAALNCSTVPLCKWILEDPPGHKATLVNRMTKAQIKEAQALAEAWKPKQ